MTLPYFQPLLSEDLARFDVPDGWSLGIAGKVQYAELDAEGHANNTAYLRWFEALRVAYNRIWGVSAPQGGLTPKMVIRSTSILYHREMLLDEDYIVTGRTRAFRNTSFTMDYAIHAPDLRASGEAVVVLVHPEGQGRLPLSEATKSRFIDIDGASAG